MKHFICFIYLLCSLSVYAQQKRALIVAVGTYSPQSRIRPIASVTDVRFIKAVLHNNNFPDKNIDTLINAQATHDAILNALDNLGKKARLGDIILIHFACHGQQIRDQKTVALGKDEDDGYDEALLPYDAKATYSPTGYKGEKHVRDDDLYPRLMKIRNAIGRTGSLLILMDACHSGTGTRAEGFGGSRGEPVPFNDPENPMDSVIGPLASDSKDDMLGFNADSLGNMVSISGSGPHQLNYQLNVDGEEVGALSYSFYKAMSEMPPGSNYRMLFEKIKARIQASIPDQSPVFEGNGDQVIFSGQYKSKDETNYIRIGKTGGEASDSLFTLNLGMMDNIVPGTTGIIFLSGMTEPVAKAVIRKVDQFRSIGIANTMLPKNNAYFIKLDQENYGQFSAGLSIEILDKKSAKAGAQINNFLSPYHFISTGKTADFQLTIRQAGTGINAMIKDRNGRTVWQKETMADSLSIEDRQSLLADLKNAMRANYLRTMDDGGVLASQVHALLIPSADKKDTSDIMLARGAEYDLRIENHGDSRIYYTVLDILPDNSISVLYPFRDKDPVNYSIGKGEKIIRNLGVSADAQSGRELIKVIVSRQPMDLRGVFERKKERSMVNSFQDMVDDLFKDSADKKSTRSDVSSVSMEEIGTITLGFTIRKE